MRMIFHLPQTSVSELVFEDHGTLSLRPPVGHLGGDLCELEGGEQEDTVVLPVGGEVSPTAVQYLLREHGQQMLSCGRERSLRPEIETLPHPMPQVEG
jgi:hypothetical protein